MGKYKYTCLYSAPYKKKLYTEHYSLSLPNIKYAFESHLNQTELPVKRGASGDWFKSRRDEAKSSTVVNDRLLFFNCSVADAIYRRKTTFLSELQHMDKLGQYTLGMFRSIKAAEIANLPL